MKALLISKVDNFINQLHESRRLLSEKIKETEDEVKRETDNLKVKENEIFDLKEKKLPYHEKLNELKVLINESITKINEVSAVNDYIVNNNFTDFIQVKKNNVNLNLNICINTAAKSKLISIKGLDLVWPKTQKKTDFTLDLEDKLMRVNYGSCWNLHFLDKIFDSENEESFKLGVKCIDNSELTHHYIAFCNSEYYNNQSCPCLYKEGFFMIHDDGKNIKQGSNYIFQELPLISKVDYTFYEFKIRASLNEFDIYVNETFYTTVKLTGDQYRFFVGKCNSGVFEYLLS